MGFNQYHEPPEELSAETRTFARMILSLIEEAEAIADLLREADVVRNDQHRGAGSGPIHSPATMVFG